MDEQELNQTIQELKNQNSQVEIRLFDRKGDRVLYKDLTNSELEKVLTALKDIKWHDLKGDK
jgi:hypothetical protein